MKKKWIKTTLPIAVLGFGILGMSLIKASANKDEEKEPVDTRPTVQVESLQSLNHEVTITSYGEVKPLEKTQLSAQVSGEVISWNPHFVAGGLIQSGDTLFTIEKDSYEAAVLQAEAEVSRANAQLIEEKGRAEVARKEAKTLPSIQVTDLYLRKPQLMSAKAAVKSAQASLKIAKRDLANCEVKAPYDALVVSRDIGLGQFINRGTPVAEINNIETAEIVFPIAGFDSAFLPQHLSGHKATVTLDGINSVSRDAMIVRDLGIVDSSTRMSHLVARIDNPYSLNSDNVAIKFGSYVKVSFAGQTLQNVYRLPQDLVSNKRVWVVDEDKLLEPRSVTVLREEDEFFLINSGLANDEQLVTTIPEYPKKGMPVKLASDTVEKDTEISNEQTVTSVN